MALPATDNFNRTDGALGANWTGSVGGDLTISTNRCAGSTTGDNSMYWSADAPNTAQYAQGKLVVDGGSSYFAALVRASSTDWVAGTGQGGSAWVIEWYNEDTYTKIGGTYSTAPAVNDVFKTTANGTTYKLYVNGTERVSGSNASAPASGYGGLYIYFNTTNYLDDFEVGNLVSGVTATLTATQASNAISASIITETHGTLTKTQAGNTLSASVTTEAKTILDVTQAGQTISASTAVSNGPAASLDATQAGNTLSASITTESHATLEQTQAGDSLTASLTTEAKASLTATQADQTIIASATVSNGPAASLDVSQAGNTISASITTEAKATLDLTQAGDTLASVTGVEAKSTLETTQADQILSANVSEAVVSTASLNQTQAGDTVSSSITTTASAVLNVTQNGNTSSSTAYAYTITYARPNADTSAGEWTDQDGGTSNLYATIDETTAEDSDYIRSPETPSADPVVFALSSISTPTYRLSHAVRYRYAKMPDGTEDTLNFTVQLREGYTNEANPGTLIAEWTHSNVSTTLATAEQALTASEAEAISNYSDLFIRMVADTA